MQSTLTGLFRRAETAAMEAGVDLEDGGTCNLDHPAFRIDRVRESSIQKIATRAGLDVTPFQWFGGRKWFWLNVPLYGQANRRARMAQAASKVLQEGEKTIKGFSACCYCQMD